MCECKCKTVKVHGDKHIKGVKVPWKESSLELSFPGAKRPGSERDRERISQGAMRPGTERARERKFQGANWPGSYWPIRSGGRFAQCI